MTMINQTNGHVVKRPARLIVANFFARWRERQRVKRDLQKLPQMPIDLLRDVGLEDQSDPKPQPTAYHRLF